MSAPPPPAPPAAPTLAMSRFSSRLSSSAVYSSQANLAASDADLRVDFTPVDMSKFSYQGYDAEYVFKYFDRSASKTISVKDLNLILTAIGINPALPQTLAACKKCGVETSGDAGVVTFEAFDRLVKEIGRPNLDRETAAQSVKIVAEFFGRDPAKPVVSVEQAQRVMMLGENKLTTAQMNHVSTMAATSGAERRGQINLNVLISQV